MITIVENTSIFESKSDVIVNTVNCVGVMGKGLAKACKEMFPDMFAVYKLLCNQGKIQIGKLWLYDKSEPKILCFPTKDHWRNPSQYSYVESGLKEFKKTYESLGIKSIAFPMLGCSNGQLDRIIVKNMIFEFLGKLPIDIELYTI